MLVRHRPGRGARQGGHSLAKKTSQPTRGSADATAVAATISRGIAGDVIRPSSAPQLRYWSRCWNSFAALAVAENARIAFVPVGFDGADDVLVGEGRTSLNDKHPILFD